MVDAGAPLTLEVNGGDPIVLAEDVTYLDLSYLVTTIAGTGGTSESADRDLLDVLFVVRRPDSLTSDEAARQFLLESWGYDVTLIDDEALPAEFDAAFTLHDVVYVSDVIDANKLSTKVADAPVGVVDEHRDQTAILGVSDDRFETQNGTGVFVDDNSHYITKPFFPGLLPLLTNGDPLLYWDDVLAAGAVPLASEPGEGLRRMLVALEAGEARFDGSPAPARRVIMPWGDGVAFSNLTADALTLLKRSLQWAGLHEVDDAVESPLFAQDRDPGATEKDYTLRADKWAVASIVPDLPPDAVSWTITEFRFLAMQKGDPTATLVLQVRRRGPAGDPLGEVLAQTFLFESDLPLAYDWVGVSFTLPEPLAPTEGACVAVGMLAGSDGGLVFYNDGNGATTPSNQFYRGKPGDWDSVDLAEDIPCEISGTIQVPDAP
jgi:hypothetical protein